MKPAICLLAITLWAALALAGLLALATNADATDYDAEGIDS